MIFTHIAQPYVVFFFVQCTHWNFSDLTGRMEEVYRQEKLPVFKIPGDSAAGLLADEESAF